MSQRAKSSLPEPSFSLLPASFYLQDTVTVARDLLGKGLHVRKGPESALVEIVEVEAYLGHEDPASHAYRGMTPRNWPMFEPGGTCYVYLSYGINFCMNVSTMTKGVGQAVLLRAAAPVFGEEMMAKNRKRGFASPYHLLSGPGKLTQALGIDLSYNGRAYYEDGGALTIVDLGRKVLASEVGASPRIGISKAKDAQLRFFLAASPWISRRG